MKDTEIDMFKLMDGIYENIADILFKFKPFN